VAALTGLARKNHSSLWNAMERVRYAAQAGQELLFDDKKGHGDIDVFMNQIEFFTREILERKSSGSGGWALSQKVRALTDNIDYWSYLISEYNKNEKIARWKFANIEYFIKMIENWERDPDNLDPGLYPYLNRISLITRDDGEDDAGAGKVNLMTIHASKGLEFPVVFIAGAEAGIIPHERSIAENEDEGGGSIEEERRLFYVAITRARDKLYISSCLKRRRLQNTTDNQPSPFLAEIPPALIEYHEEEKPAEDISLAADFFARIGGK
jgi:DNA helicase-2/ATP-dependent DNA helicase PcrA